MSVLVSRNTIKLGASASLVDGYYNGYTIILTRFDSITGKEVEQKKTIASYNGASKIATIDGIWDTDFIPTTTDRYKIVPTYPDSRVSINTAIQTLDYITSDRYGKGLKPNKDLHMPSWLESARICDTRSDVTIQFSGDISTLQPDAVYRYQITDGLEWEGKVSQIKPNGYVRFTDVIGKYSHKWNSWKSFRAGSLVYVDNRLYRTDIEGVKSTEPTHTLGTVDGLTFMAPGDVAIGKVSGIGPVSIVPMVDGNPVRDINQGGIRISGYSLYDSDGIDYWRYIGWDEHSQRYVTRHQTNLIIDTSVPLLDNINNLLEHFGGILRYTAGKYYLEVEAGEGDIPNSSLEPRNITEDNIIGKIRINDEGLRSSFNSLTVAYADPANKFEAKNISFFNSEYLKTDRNVPKKGNVSIPGITNYYNARLVADRFLIQSRFGLTVSMNLEPKGALLLSGKVIQIQNDRYGWVNKKFRIQNISHNPDATVDIVAKEYDDKFYVIKNISRPPSAALAGEVHTSTNIQPSGLRATSIDSNDETIAGIELSWTNSPAADTTTVSTEIFSSHSPKLLITVIDIDPTNALTSNADHGLSKNDTLTSQSDLQGLQFGATYFVSEIISPTRFRISLVQNGAAAVLIPGTGLSINFLSANIIGTVPYPTVSFIDVVNGLEGQRVQKYYWIRNKITQR